MRSKLIVAAAVATGVCLASVACSAGSAAEPRSAAALVAGRPVPGANDRPFGTDCARLPLTAGPGSRRGLPRLPVATAIAQVPQLSELSRAITLAGLTEMLNTAPALTVFAPDNAAFRQLGTGNLQALFGTKSDLAPVLKFQIVAGRVRPTELARQKVLTSIAGTRIYPTRAAPSYFVNNAWISCGDLSTANATVYIVSNLIIPAT
jgi:uncharacterized surface protein with fasciclin (FAS1) repeats